MALTVDDVLITSDDAPNERAECWVEGNGVRAWSVSGPILVDRLALGGRKLNRTQAITAMTLAELYAIDPPPSDPVWAHESTWRAEVAEHILD